MTDRTSKLGAALCAATLALLFGATGAAAEDSPKAATAAEAPADPVVGAWPKISFDTLAMLEYSSLRAASGTSRGPGLSLRFDSTALIEFNDALSLDGLFQFKPREPRPLTDPNRDLFINQGAGRAEGGKMKELYVRYGDYRFGKFVQDFGRGYAIIPGPFAADFIEEPEEGYEPADMIGAERIHVFGNENTGWRQISLSAFMVDRTFLHQSFPYNEGMIRLRDGGIGNTRLPENIMATYDVLEQPIGHWAHMNYQASVIRWGKSYGAQASELWSTLGADISIPLTGSVADTLRGRYSQLHLFVEGARRDNFNGVRGQARDYLTLATEYLTGPWVMDLTTTQRWTHGAPGGHTDALYTTTLGYTLPSAALAAFSIGSETVDGRRGVYAGLRISQPLTVCSKCMVKGRAF